LLEAAIVLMLALARLNPFSAYARGGSPEWLESGLQSKGETPESCPEKPTGDHGTSV